MADVLDKKLEAEDPGSGIEALLKEQPQFPNP
jgi:hypothetical protein